jgi:hypothetical protein
MNFSSVTNRIIQLIEEWEHKLIEMGPEAVSQNRNSQNRTIRQILGHLTDSASNNHQRIIRLQYNHILEFPDYRQDNDLWIELQNFQHENWYNLVQHWKYSNLHLAHVINSVDCSKLTNYWEDFEGTKVSLKQMIEEYTGHLKLHLNEIQELADQ